MKEKHLISLLILIILILACMIVLQNEHCFAAFGLSAQPYGGGYDIRFGRVSANDTKQVKEVTIRVTSDIGKQYRVYQRIEEPLRMADGTEVDPDQFKMFTLINSNSKGTLERIEEYPVMLHDEVLYTSNSAGESDSFRIAYTLTPRTNQAPGSYYGRIIYFVRAIDSAQEQVIETMNMYADLSNEGAVEISTNTGFKRIRIFSRDFERLTPSQYPYVKVSVQGNMGTRYRIYQKLKSAQVKSDSGESFDLSKVTFTSYDVKTDDTLNKGDLSLLRTKTLVYASDDRGSGTDIIITYRPTDDFVHQKASYYTGSIEYYLELDNIRTFAEPGFIDAVDFEFEIEPIFRILAFSITEEGEVQREGGMLLQFGDIGYKKGTKESTVRLKIDSNLGKPYLVTQKFTTPLESDAGDTIPEELFTFEMKKTDSTRGKLKFDEEAAIEAEADTPIFVSNAGGENDELDITYKLKVTPDTRAGAYATQISYSLSEL